MAEETKGIQIGMAAAVEVSATAVEVLVTATEKLTTEEKKPGAVMVTTLGKIPKKDLKRPRYLPCMIANLDFLSWAHDPVSDPHWEKEHAGLEWEYIYTAMNLYRRFPVRANTADGFSRNLWQCFAGHQRIRHIAGNSEWVAMYDPNDDTICMSEALQFKSPTSFATAHNNAAGIEKAVADGWDECEYDTDGKSHISAQGKARFLSSGTWAPLGRIKAPIPLLPLPDNWLEWHIRGYSWE
jgi:hypothetical protein